MSLSASNILIVGSGGREHALAHKLAQSPHAEQIYVAPGNGGTAQMQQVSNVNITPNDISRLIQFAQDKNIDYTVIGPEAPLVAGIVDQFHEHNLVCIGPTQAAAQLEASKQFAKDFMQKNNIPTAQYQVVTTIEQAEQYITYHPEPIVVKADGLTGGKGVIIAQTKQDAHDAVASMLLDNTFGDAGKTVILEQFLTGEEVSFIVFTDGTHIVPLATCQDYKARNDGNQGPNTGGMGAHSPAPCITPELHERIMKEVIEPTITGMKKQGTPFTGFLYAGLMITPEGDPYVLEFNCRLGDPETQLIMSRMKTDLLTLLRAANQKTVSDVKIEWDEQSAVTVIIADGDYPKSCTKGQPISLASHPDVTIFHAGTAVKNNKLVSNGGRLLGITALGETFKDAREKVYNQIKDISLPHMHYRTDIALNLHSK